MGAATATVACNKDAEISKYAQMPIEVDAGPEFLTGSTRLKSGTSSKINFKYVINYFHDWYWESLQ